MWRWHYKDDRMAGRTKGVRHTRPEPSKGRGEARYFTPKSKAEELSAEVVWGATGVQDQKSKKRKTKGTRAGYGDGDGERCGRW